MHWVPALALAALTTGSAGDDGRHVVRLEATPADDVVLEVPTVDELRDGDVLVVHVTGGVPDAAGFVRQCTVTATRFAACRNLFPVQFDAAGAARFQYQVDDDAGRCDGTAGCAVVVGDEGRDRIAYAFTVFGGPAPPQPAIVLAPAGPYAPGDDVDVEVTGSRPGATVRAALCGESCGPSVTAQADASGNARLRVALGARCDDCGIVVVAGATSSVVPVRFVAPPSADYDSTRLIAGLAAAAMLLLVAVRLVATTDWRPPSDAQVPDVD